MILTILGALLALTVLFVLRQHGVRGIREGVLVSLGVIRNTGVLIMLGIALAAMSRVILPDELISRWLGAEAGIIAILIGTGLGALVHGGPYVVFPLVGSIIVSGAGVGAMAAFVTAWCVIPITRTVMWEIPFMGPRMATARFIVSLPFPILAGLLTPPVFELLS